MGAMPDAGTGLVRPEGCTLDLAYVHAVATRTNAAQRTMGTDLLAIERHAVTIGLAWREDLATSTGGGLATGVLVALLDHACSLAALVSIDDVARCGATMGMRVDRLAPAAPRRPVSVVGRCVGQSAEVAFVHGSVFHPDRPDTLLATATATVARTP